MNVCLVAVPVFMAVVEEEYEVIDDARLQWRNADSPIHDMTLMITRGLFLLF